MWLAADLGHNCKYSGGNNRNEKLINFLKDQEVLCVCPEVLGGLPIPRASSEIRGDKVINTNGEDVSKQFYAGALKALQKTLEFQPDLAILEPEIVKAVEKVLSMMEPLQND